MTRRKPSRPCLCSRVGCQQQAVTRVFHDCRWHQVCKACWLEHMDQLDRPPAAAHVVDRKMLAAGDA